MRVPDATIGWKMSVQECQSSGIVSVRLGEREITGSRFLQSFGSKEVFVPVGLEAFGQSIEQRLFIAEALINCWRGGAGFALPRHAASAVFAARAP